jgi:hypothetical protein
MYPFFCWVDIEPKQEFDKAALPVSQNASLTLPPRSQHSEKQ